MEEPPSYSSDLRTSSNPNPNPNTWTTDWQHNAGTESQVPQWLLEVLHSNMSQCHPKCSEGQKIPERKASLPALAASDWPIAMLSSVCVCDL